MRYDLVIRITGSPDRLVRSDVMFCVPPIAGDTVFWNGDWSGISVQYRYVASDYVELGLGHIIEEEAGDFIAAGWERQK